MPITDKAKRKEIDRAYYLANKERIIERNRLWRAEHKDQFRESKRGTRRKAKERSGQEYKSRAQILEDAARKRACREQERIARKTRARKPIWGSRAWLEAASQSQIAAYRKACRDKYKKRYERSSIVERERSKAYKHSNPEKVARWQSERASILASRDDGSLTRAVVGHMFGEAEGKRCPYCWHTMRGDQKSMDHIIPRVDGGVHSVINVVICCRPCNIRKGGRPFTDWVAALPAAGAERARRLYRKRYGCDPTQASLALAFLSADQVAA